MSDEPQKEPLPPGVLPNITDTDPPPLHPDTVVGDGHVGAPPGCQDTPQITYDGITLTCTMGNWTGTPESYAYQWQMDGQQVGADAPSYVVQAADAGKAATCIVTATNSYGSTAAAPSNAIGIAPGDRWDRPPIRPPARQTGSDRHPEGEHEAPESHPDHPEHRSWLERMGRSGRGERHK